MKIKSLITGFGLTEGKIYDVLFEYDTVYEVKCDDEKTYCRNKDFFEIVEMKKEFIINIDNEEIECHSLIEIIDFLTEKSKSIKMSVFQFFNTVKIEGISIQEILYITNHIIYNTDKLYMEVINQNKETIDFVN